MKSSLACCLFFLSLLSCIEGAEAQNTRARTVLSTRGFAIVPSGFYVKTVFDERTGQDSTGALFFSADGESVTHKISLRSASFAGVGEFLSGSVARDTSLRPINIRIQKLDIREAISADGEISGEINLAFSFDLDKGDWTVLLTRYQAAAKYKRSLANLAIVEPTLLNLLANSVKFIDNWLAREASSDPNLAKKVKLSFHNYLEQHDDTVYYDAGRPLVWDDFREARRDHNFAAAVFPSFGYDQRAEVKEGVIHVELDVKVFMVKSASWAAPGAQNAYNLNHEQRHFDLVKLVADRFKKKLLSEKLSPENYQGVINFEYLEFYREMNKIQKDYDEQTSHGKSQSQQDIWNRRIDLELKQLSADN